MLPIIPHDKALHAIYGSALSLVGALLALALGFSVWTGSMALPLIFGVAKEMRDRWAEAGTPDKWDAVATVAGALPTIIVAAVGAA
jgi:hypothetical protein